MARGEFTDRDHFEDGIEFEDGGEFADGVDFAAGGDFTAGGQFTAWCWRLQLKDGLVWFDLAPWHINHCRLSNSKSCLYIYIRNIYHLEIHFLENILKRAWAHLLHTVNWLQVLQSKTNNSIYYKSFVCTQLNGFKNCYVTVTIWHQSFVCTHINWYTWYVRDEFVGNFIFKRIRTHFLPNSIAIGSKQLNVFNYCYRTLIIIIMSCR